VNAVATAATGLFYVATSAGLFRMQVPEFLFHKVINGPGASATKGVAATDDGLVLAITQDSIWRSTNNGTTWQSFGRIDEGTFQAYTIARDGAIITSTTQGNIYLRRLVDDGWRDISGELKGNPLLQLLAHRDGELYALTKSLEIYRASEIPASVEGMATSVSLSAVIEPSVVSHYATLRLSVRTLDEYRIDVYDAHGEVVLSIPSLTLLTGDHQIPLDLSQLHSGRYWCSVWSDAAMTLCTLQVIR
jgi:hypothetical protein